MGMRIKQSILVLALLFGLVPGVLAMAAPASTASAYNPIGKACQGQGSGSTACNSQGTNNVVGKDGIIARATRLVAGVGAVIAVIVIVIYGFQMITSYGDSGKVTTARNAVVGAVVGLVIIGLAQAIVVFIISNI
jgi:hypothetical protein